MPRRMLRMERTARQMLEIKGVHKTFNIGTINEKKALQGVDLTLNDGDFVTVIGGNAAENRVH